MKTVTFTAFRQHMKEHLNEIENDQDILILSGPKKKKFVVLTLDQFNAMEETAYIQSTPANATRLMESIEQDKANNIAHSFNLEPEAAIKAAVLGKMKTARKTNSEDTRGHGRRVKHQNRLSKYRRGK